MTEQTKRTLRRLLALFLAAGAGDALIQFATSNTYDVRHLIGVLAAAAIMAGEKYLASEEAADPLPPHG